MRSTLSLLALSTSIGHAAAQSSGTFNTLTFNVAGLPAILNGNDVPGDKTANTARIGQLFAQYKISLIHVQEDFNYHATLYANDNHPFRTPTSRGVPIGSGLNSLSNYEYAGFERVKWNKCSNTDSQDCLTAKGFTFMRVKFAEGIWIDAYNLHADAGTTAADSAARAANLLQVSDHIKKHSTGNPVLVFGDSNSRYTRKGDIPFIFQNENGMTDAWVQLIRKGVSPTAGTDTLKCENPSLTADCEIVDKTWYRGSSAVTLKAQKFQYTGKDFTQLNGDILSDHNGVLVDWVWEKSARLRISDTFGSEFGNWYNDLDTVAGISNPRVSSVTLRGGERVDAVSLTLSSGHRFPHGGTGGTDATLTLENGEALIKSTLCRGDKNDRSGIFYIEMTTSKGRTVTKGTKTGDCVTRSAEDGWSIVGFLGSSGEELNQVGFIYSKA